MVMLSAGSLRVLAGLNSGETFRGVVALAARLDGSSVPSWRVRERALAAPIDTMILINTIVQWVRRRASASLALSSHPLSHRKEYEMDATNGLKETTRVTPPVASNTLGVNVFTAPGKAMVGERPKPFGEALGFDPITSTLIFGEFDAVLVDAMGTVAEAEALANWVALHNRNLETIYVTHAHFDHF